VADNKISIYHILIRESLDEKWHDWFGDFQMISGKGNMTLLCSKTGDQSSLLGALEKIHSLGLTFDLVLHTQSANLTDCGCTTSNRQEVCRVGENSFICPLLKDVPWAVEFIRPAE
jgi:hypothetical protein